MAGVAAQPEDVRDVYEAQAVAFDARRSKAFFEARWLARFAAALPAGGHVLDLGCGTGEPIARWFLAEGFRVTGLDFAQAMLDIARARMPEATWLHADMRRLDLGTTFDGIVGWNSFFHLPPRDQPDCIARMARHLVPGGSLLLTVGDAAGETAGTVEGRQVYHASLSPAEYALCLERNGMALTGFLSRDPETQDHTILMARRVDRP